MVMCGGGGKRKKQKQQEINMENGQVKSKVESKVKFFIDLRKDKKILAKLNSMLVKLNEKDYGRELGIKDLFIYGFNKITDKDVEKIKEGSLSAMEKVESACMAYNVKNDSKLSVAEFMVKKLAL